MASKFSSTATALSSSSSSHRNVISRFSSEKNFGQNCDSIVSLIKQAQLDLQRPIFRGVQNYLAASKSRIPRVSFVASAVLATPSTCDCGPVCVCPPLLRFTGVNSALHRQVNMMKCSDVGDNHHQLPVIRGLLKGCAEQNALGSFAAGGNAFSQVRAIVICNLVLNNESETTNANNDHSSSSSTASAFPCNACRNYLRHVQKFVVDRHCDQCLNLSCVSLNLLPQDDVIEASAIEKKETTKQVTLECISGWKTDFHEEVLTLL